MELEFSGNRKVVLYEFRQYVTYEGLLEGLPTAEGNQRRIAHLLEEPENQRYGIAPYLIPPVEKPLEYTADERYPFGTPSALPSVVCVARLESFQPTNRADGDGSGLVVIWFQNEFALPVDPIVVEHLRTVDWNLHAGSFEY